MRYPKGSIQLNDARDLPLLRQVLRSEFVAHSQLFEFMRLNHCEQSRKSFDWRVRRLFDRGLVRRQTISGCTGDFIYSISSSSSPVMTGDAPSCSTCGMLMVPNGSCYKCANCGSTSGCS